MKRIYLGLFAAAFSASAYGQLVNTVGASKNYGKVVTKMASGVQKAEGDEVWSNDFSLSDDWEMGTLAGHTNGGWSIVSAMPVNLNQIFQDFPTLSGGNFAIINSDLAGSTASQNAWIGNQGVIAVADILADLGEAPNKGLYFSFTEIYRRYRENYYVEVSNDNGATWKSFQVNQVGVNTNSTKPEYELINISSVIEGDNWSNEVKFRFRYQGAYDFFWAVDDVKITVAVDNDMVMETLYQAVDTQLPVEYYTVPTSQVSFPGLTFGALAYNIGNGDQAEVTFNVSSVDYNENSAPIAINARTGDSLSISTPFMIPQAVGSYTVRGEIAIAATDASPANNVKSMVVKRDPYIYARDNGTVAGSISQISSQDGQPLWIGNEMEIFDDISVSSIQVRLMYQEGAIDQMIDARIEIYDPINETYVYLAETEPYSITANDLATFVKLPLVDGPITIPAGSIVLVMAHHYGGSEEVFFGTAQNTFTGTVVGRTADNSLFTLSDTRAIMIRLDSEPSSVGINAVNELKGVKLYPNPSTGVINVSNDYGVNNTIVVTDLTGKVITSKIVGSATTVDLTNFGTGMYMIEISNVNGKKVEKVVIK